jgi:hypothetical protein
VNCEAAAAKLFQDVIAHYLAFSIHPARVGKPAVSDRRADHRRAWREDVALRVAHALEQAGVASAPRPNL